MAYAILGPCGTFSEEAARLYWGRGVKLKTVEDLDLIGQLLVDGQIQGALVPWHNTLTGWVKPTMELLKAYRLVIRGQIDMPVKQHLMAPMPYSLRELEVVISHPLALKQCQDFINVELSGIKLEHFSSTAGAARTLLRDPRKAASIGSHQAAQLYGLQILKHNINNPGNTTRFVHIAKYRKATAINTPSGSFLLPGIPR